MNCLSSLFWCQVVLVHSRWLYNVITRRAFTCTVNRMVGCSLLFSEENDFINFFVQTTIVDESTWIVTLNSLFIYLRHPRRTPRHRRLLPKRHQPRRRKEVVAKPRRRSGPKEKSVISLTILSCLIRLPMTNCWR